MRFAEQRSSRIFLAFEAVFDNGFDRERAGDFAVRLAAHSVREHIEVERRDDAVAVFVIGAHHAHVRGATGRDLQVHSPWAAADGDNSARTPTGSQIEVIRGELSGKGRASY